MNGRRALYLEQPAEVAIETLALCNAACTFCPYPTIERQGVEMPRLRIDGLISEMADFKHPFVFSPFKLNEPFLDYRLADICRSFEFACNVTAAPGRLRLFSNGSALTPATLAWIAQLSRVHHLWVSVNSLDEAEHQALMQFKRPLLPKIIAHLNTLHAWVATGEFTHPVVVSRVATGTAGDLDFLKGVDARWPRFTAQLIKKDAWLQDITAPEIEIPATPCGRWFELSIMATGIASLCCMDSESKFPIGDVNHQSLLSIYNAPLWRGRRERMLNRHEVPICQTCSY